MISVTFKINLSDNSISYTKGPKEKRIKIDISFNSYDEAKEWIIKN